MRLTYLGIHGSFRSGAHEQGTVPDAGWGPESTVAQRSGQEVPYAASGTAESELIAAAVGAGIWTLVVGAVLAIVGGVLVRKLP